MLLGSDISHWNGNINVDMGDFIIMKATEGCTFIDPLLTDNLDKWLKGNGTKLGLYHFARPEYPNTTPESEAKAFISVIKPFLKFHPLLVIDWEQKALNKKYNQYCLSLLQEVQRLTGIKPVLYTNTTGTKILGKLCTSYPLWIASYNKKTPTFYNWDIKKVVLWQYTSTPFDLDIFLGDELEWCNLTGAKI